MNNHPLPPCEEYNGALPEIFQLIEGLEKRLRAFQSRTLKEAGLTPPQYYLLSLLSENDGRPFKDLAAALGCTRATITGIVDTLEKKGLVVRTPHREDRRSTLANLTNAGRNLIDATQGLEKTFGSCCCDLLPPEEIAQLGHLLKKLSAALPF